MRPNVILATICAGALCATTWAQSTGTTEKSVAQLKIEAAKAQIVAAESRLESAKQASQQGAVGEEAVLIASVELAEKKIGLAKLEQNAAGLGIQLGQIVVLRQSLYDHALLRQQAGTESSMEVASSRMSLAKARIRVETFTVFQLASQQHQEAAKRFAAGGLGQKALDEAKSALDESAKAWDMVESGRSFGQL